MVVRSGPRRGVGIEAPQQHSAVGFPQLVEIAVGESPGHTAVEHDLEYFRLQETDLVCHCDVWVVVHRPAVLEEAVPGVASPAFDLRGNIPNAADGAAKIHEGVDLAVPLPRGLHGNRFCLHGGGAHVHGHRLLFRHYETERRTDLDDGRHHLFQASLRLRGDASVVGVQHGPEHPLGCILGQITPCNHTHKYVCTNLRGVSGRQLNLRTKACR